MIVTYNGFTFNKDHVSWISHIKAINTNEPWLFEIGLCDGTIFTSHTGTKEEVTLCRDIFIQYLNDGQPREDLDDYIQSMIEHCGLEKE